MTAPLTRLIGSLVAAAGLAACAADIAPSAEIQSATPDQLTPSDDASDDLTIALRYDDGDGDLGGGVADVYDCRADGVVTELAIPPIAADRDRPRSAGSPARSPRRRRDSRRRRPRRRRGRRRRRRSAA